LPEKINFGLKQIDPASGSSRPTSAQALSFLHPDCIPRHACFNPIAFSAPINYLHGSLLRPLLLFLQNLILDWTCPEKET
jgi:hypothetical protein